MAIDTPDLTLFHLKAKAQDLYPEHTYKAVLRRVYREKETTEERVQMLAEMVAEFERGMAC